ncbi:MAG: 50S ribosomal protein L32 [Clostridiales bacterium]|jgi:large subunit ribosomal protein L32|nr:50S ribosomal protein L32 [Clostridiales bacterium]
MAVPKRKTSKERKRTRAANWKVTAPNLTECPQCHEKKQSHVVCPHCGYYKNELIVAPKQKSE